MSKPGIKEKVMAKLSQLSLPYPRSKKNKINNVSGDNNNNSNEGEKTKEVKRRMLPPKRCHMKKAVLKLDLHDEKDKRKAMKTVSRMSGVETIQMDLKDRTMTLVGDIDPIAIVSKLRKLCYTELVSVGPSKEPEKKKGGGGDDGDVGVGGGDGGDGGVGGDGGGDGGSGSDDGDGDGWDKTEGGGGGGDGGKMGTKMEPMGQPDFRRFKYNSGDENEYPVGQLYMRNYEKPNVCSIIPYEKNMLMATAVVAAAVIVTAAAVAKWQWENGYQNEAQGSTHEKPNVCSINLSYHMSC